MISHIHFLEAGIVVLVTQNSNTDKWVSEDSVFATYHVISELVLKFFFVILVLQLYPMGLLNFNSDLLACITHGVVDFVSNFEI